MRVVGYQFLDDSLQQLALTHRSTHGSKNNERLEFIGDSILGHIISLELYRYFPNANEGQLSRLRSILVRGETLATIAKELDLGSFIKLGSGELKTGGQRRKSILADTLEALIGAIYLDSNFETTRQVILPWFSDRLVNLDPDALLKDAKSRLQEWLQGRNRRLPVYRVSEQSGPQHNQRFVVECLVEDLSITVFGAGGSRRIAEQDAAQQVLSHLETSK